MKVKKRLDVLLTERNLADSRSKAQAVIMSGLVYVDGQKADKPGVSYEETVEIEVRGAVCPYVSRGGLKLEKALRDFGVQPVNYVCSDSGASTGGFTDCLLQQGAKKVFAIDVGYGQLDWKLRQDERVVCMERTTGGYLGSASAPACSEATARAIDEKVVEIVRTQHAKAVRLLRENEAKLDELAKFIYEKETITGAQFMEILER